MATIGHAILQSDDINLVSKILGMTDYISIFGGFWRHGICCFDHADQVQNIAPFFLRFISRFLKQNIELSQHAMQYCGVIA